MKKEQTAALAGVFAAFGASACCLGPPLLAALGFGTATLAAVRELGAYRLPLTLLSLLFLAGAVIGHVLAARRERACPVPPGSQPRRPWFLLVALGISGVLLVLPLIL